jgi:hypothetical protein
MSVVIAGEKVYLDTVSRGLGSVNLTDYAVGESVKHLFRPTVPDKYETCDSSLSVFLDGLKHRLHTLEVELPKEKKDRANSVTVRTKLDHIQKLSDYIGKVDKAIKACIVLPIDPLAGKLPMQFTEEQLKMLVRKFAVVILHAKEPKDVDRDALNAVTVNVLTKVEAVKNLTPEFEAAHMKPNGFLKTMISLGRLGESAFIQTLFKDFLEKTKATTKPYSDKLDTTKSAPEQVTQLIGLILARVADLDKELALHAGEAADLQKKLDTATSALAAAGPHATELEEHKRSLKEKLDACTGQKDKLQIDLDEAKKVKTATETAAAAAAAAARARIAELDAEVKAQKERIAGLEGEIRQCQADSLTESEKVAKLKGERDQLLVSQTSDKRTRDEILARVQAELEAAQKAAREAAEAARQKNERLQKQLDEEVAKGARLKTEKEALNESLRLANVARDAAVEEVSRVTKAQKEAAEKAQREMDAAIADFKAQLLRARQDLDAATTKSKELEATVKQLQEQLAKCTGEKGEKDDEIRKLQGALETAKTELAAEQAKVAAKEKDIARITAENGATVARLAREKEEALKKLAAEKDAVAAGIREKDALAMKDLHAQFAREKTEQEAATAAAIEKKGKEDMEKLRILAAQVLSGKEKWSSYPGANAPLQSVLRKLDNRMNDICVLVYFVSYLLNIMIRPKILDDGVRDLIATVKSVVGEIDVATFDLLMGIEPSLLLANKIMDRAAGTNYVISQDTAIMKTLVEKAHRIDSKLAWKVVRNSKGKETAMKFIPMQDKILLVHRPGDEGEATSVQAYADGIVSPARETGEYTAIEKEKGISYDALFLVFLYTAKKYIVDNKDKIHCIVPEEIITNSKLEEGVVKYVPPPPQAAPPPPQAAPPPEPGEPQVFLEGDDTKVALRGGWPLMEDFISKLLKKKSGIERFTMIFNNYEYGVFNFIRNQFKKRLAWRLRPDTGGAIKYTEDAGIRSKSFMETINVFINLQKKDRDTLLYNNVGIFGKDTYNFSLAPYLLAIIKNKTIVDIIIEDLNTIANDVKLRADYIRVATDVSMKIVNLASEVAAINPAEQIKFGTLRQQIKNYPDNDIMLDLLTILNIGKDKLSPRRGRYTEEEVKGNITAIRTKMLARGGSQNTRKKSKNSSKKFTQRKR